MRAVLAELILLPGEDADAPVAEITSYESEELEPAMRARHAGAGITFDTLAAFPGLDTPGDADVVALAKRLARRNDHAKVAFGTEGGRFAAELGVPTVVVGPGSISQAHKPDEFIAVSEPRRCEAFLERLVLHCTEEPS